jgi:WD40 repeat protein
MTSSNTNPNPDASSVEIGVEQKIGSMTGGQAIGVSIQQVRDAIIHIHQRALTAEEGAERAADIELKLLAQGVGRVMQGLKTRLDKAASGGSPYKGLPAYGLEDADRFYGRSAATASLLDALDRGRLAVLHAESGAGKTSLLQAGLAARLIAAGRLAVYLRPYRAQPIITIKEAFLDLGRAPRLAGLPLREFLRYVTDILGPGETLYLLLDQFEEFFAYLDPPARTAFATELAACLHDESLNVRWVIALRGEALSRLAEMEASGVEPFENQYRLARLTRDEAREVITGPGFTFEPGLVETILDGLIKNGEAPLPQLQLVCRALTEGLKPPAPVGRAQYDRLGGVEGIQRDFLVRQVAQFPAEEREPARRLLRELVTADDRRAVLAYPDLVTKWKKQTGGSALLDTLLGRLVERRLVVVQERGSDGEKLYELAHDTLLREIQLDPAEQARKAAQEMLDRAVADYRANPRLLLDGDKYDAICPRRKELRVTLEAEELLRKSEAAVHRRRRLVRRVTALIAALGLVVLTLVVVTLWQRATNRLQTSVNRVSLLAAESRTAAAKHPQLSLLLASEAVKDSQALGSGHRVVVAEQALLDGLSTTGGLPLNGHSKQIYGLQSSRNGKWLVSWSYRDGTWLWNLDAAERAWQSNARDLGAAQTVLDSIPIEARFAFSPNSRWLSTFGGGRIRIWDLRTDKPNLLLAQFDGHTSSAAFGPDNCHLAAGDTSGTIRIWNLCQKSPVEAPVIWAGHATTITVTAYSPDGRWLATSDTGSALKLWDMARQQPGSAPVVLNNPVTAIDRIDFDPTGAWLLASKGQGPAAVWHIAGLAEDTARVKLAPVLREGLASRSTFSGDGRWLAALHPAQGKQGSTGRFDVVLYRLAPDVEKPEIQMSCSFSGYPWDLEISHDGRWVVISEEDGRIELIDTISGSTCASRMLNAPGGIGTTVHVSKDSRWLVAWTDRQRIAHVWHLPLPADNSEPMTLNAHEGGITTADFGADGRWLATGDSKGEIRLWDLASATPATAIPLIFENGNDSFSNSSRSVLTSDARWVASTYLRLGGDTTGVAFWRTSPGASGAPGMRCPTSSMDLVGDFAFNEETGILLIQDFAGSFDLFDFDLTQGKCKHREFLDLNQWPWPDSFPAGISPDGHWLVTQDVQSQSLELRDPTAGSAAQPIRCGVASPDAEKVADGEFFLSTPDNDAGPSAASEQNAMLWRRLMWGHDKTGNLWCQEQKLPEAKNIASSTNREWAAVVTEKNGAAEVEIWHSKNREQQLTGTVSLGNASSRQVAIANSGQWIATPAARGIHLWRLAPGTSDPISRTLALPDLPASLAFSHDSRWLAASSEDAAIRLWDLTGDAPSLPLVLWMDPAYRGSRDNSEYNPVAAGINFSADGRWLIGVSSVAVKMWPLDLATLLDLSCRTAGRNLTPDESPSYLPDAQGRLVCPSLPAGQ